MQLFVNQDISNCLESWKYAYVIFFLKKMRYNIFHAVQIIFCESSRLMTYTRSFNMLQCSFKNKCLKKSNQLSWNKSKLKLTNQLPKILLIPLISLVNPLISHLCLVIILYFSILLCKFGKQKLIKYIFTFYFSGVKSRRFWNLFLILK